MDGHRSVIVCMSILTTTIDRAFNQRSRNILSIIFSTDDNFRIMYPCHIVLNSTWSIDVTS